MHPIETKIKPSWFDSDHVDLLMENKVKLDI